MESCENMAYNCPYAIRLKSIGNVLLCKKIMKQGVDYNLQNNASTVFCCCQRFCRDLRKNVNSDGAKKCYEYHLLN